MLGDVKLVDHVVFKRQVQVQILNNFVTKML